MPWNWRNRKLLTDKAVKIGRVGKNRQNRHGLTPITRTPNLSHPIGPWAEVVAGQPKTLSITFLQLCNKLLHNCSLNHAPYQFL